MMCNGSVKVIDPERHTMLTMAYLPWHTYLHGHLLPILTTLTILTLVKVIDPEFTVFAPPGLDAGSQQQHPRLTSPCPTPTPNPTPDP